VFVSSHVLRRSWFRAATAGFWLSLVAGAHPAWAGQEVSAPGTGGPLTLQQVLDEALARNPELIALEREYDRARRAPDTARGFEPPMFETQIWRWPINTLDPSKVDMYMFSMGQSLPGRGKRDSRAALSEATAALAGASIEVRARQIVDDVKQAWADLYLVRKAIEVNTKTVTLLRQFADIASVKYATGSISQQDVLAGIVELSRLHEQLIVLEEQERLAAAGCRRRPSCRRSHSSTSRGCRRPPSTRREPRPRLRPPSPSTNPISVSPAGTCSCRT